MPEKAEIKLEFRHLAEDPPEELLNRIKAAAQRVSARHQARFPVADIAIEALISCPGLDTDAKSAGTTKVAFGTEAGYFSAHLSIPTIVCGPGSMAGQGHKPNEFVALCQLQACDAMSDQLLIEMSG